MTVTRCIFLDIDGPMIPVKAYMLPNQTKLVTLFDPIAAEFLRRLLLIENTKIVISSTWRLKGRDKCVELLEKNGIAETCLHDDWGIDEGGRSSATRSQTIGFWLTDHPEVTNWVSIDDEKLSVHLDLHHVYCDTYEGMSYRNYLEALIFLGGRDNQGVGNDGEDEYRRYIQFLKRSAISHISDDIELQTRAEELYPNDNFNAQEDDQSL